MPSNLPAGCTQYSYESQPGRDPSGKRTPENSLDMEYCINCGRGCERDELVLIPDFDFFACPQCLLEHKAIQDAENEELLRHPITGSPAGFRYDSELEIPRISREEVA